MKLLNWLNDFSNPEENENSNPDLAPALKARLSELETIPVEKIMIPRALITALDVDVQLRRVRRLKSAKVSYFPVYRGDLDQILGWVGKDKVLELLNEQHPDESALLANVRPAGEVSETASVADLADAFLAASSPFLVVKNSQRQTIGIVPLSEFVEKIFGFEGSPAPSLELMDPPNAL